MRFSAVLYFHFLYFCPPHIPEKLLKRGVTALQLNLYFCRIILKGFPDHMDFSLPKIHTLYCSIQPFEACAVPFQNKGNRLDLRMLF